MPRKQLDDQKAEKLRNLIRAGTPAKVAAAAAGIPDFDALLEDPEFCGMIAETHAEAESALVTRITKAAANGSWQAAAFLLRHRWPERWADDYAQPEQPELERKSKLDELSARRSARISDRDRRTS